MFVNLNMSKIGQNKWVCEANQMVCLEKFFLEAFESGITRRWSFQDTTSPFLAYTRCQDFGHTTAWAFPPLIPLKFKIEPLCHNISSGKEVSGLCVWIKHIHWVDLRAVLSLSLSCVCWYSRVLYPAPRLVERCSWGLQAARERKVLKEKQNSNSRGSNL